MQTKVLLLRAEQTQFCQPFLIWQIFQSCDHSHGPSPPAYLHLFCIVGTKTESSKEPGTGPGTGSVLLSSSLAHPPIIMWFFYIRHDLLVTIPGTIFAIDWNYHQVVNHHFRSSLSLSNHSLNPDFVLIPVQWVW